MTHDNQSQLWQVVGVAAVVVLVAVAAVIGLRPTQRTTFRADEAPPSDAPSAEEAASPAPTESAADQPLDAAIRLWSSGEDLDLEGVRQLLEDAASASPDAVEVQSALGFFWAERFVQEKKPEDLEKAIASLQEAEAIDTSSPLAHVSRALIAALTAQSEQTQETAGSIREALQVREACLPKPLCERGYRLLEEGR
ncbi:MAG: hypothetical protein AAF725_18650 [Acidobacteriota bacterium]